MARKKKRVDTEIDNVTTSVELDPADELNYYKDLKKKNKNYLIDGLDEMEMERIAGYIIDLYNEVLPKHNEMCDRIDEWDQTWRMERRQLVGDDGDMPNYRTPLSTVTHETIHANLINVFFSPKDPMRVIPTEPNDVPKINKLTTFGNWSMKNEMGLVENIDRLFHCSGKNGECPYIVHWVKEYATEIIRTPKWNPEDHKEPLYDVDTGEVLFDEKEEAKLVYNGPKLEIISRKDYLQPDNAMMGELPDWEIVIRRYSYDDVWKEQMQGKMYDESVDKIKQWGQSEQAMAPKKDYQGDTLSIGKWEKEFIQFYGKLRISIIKSKSVGSSHIEPEEITELEDEFIAIVHKTSKTLCSLRKNKFPLKMRPVGMDYFIPDDEGRRAGIGIFEFMQSMQHAYDALFNQFIFGVTQSNNPFGFFTPTGNMRDDSLKIRNGYMYPTADAGSINMVTIPAPNQQISAALQLINNWAQLMFGISDYTAGVESKIDPTAPARKAAIVVEQGNVRLNMTLKRKNLTMKDIFKRWYLLYRDNMPPNKFMRIVGDDENNPWKFEAIKIEDFQLKSLPDFELTGNVLSANKQLQINTAIATYQLLVGNPFFSPQTTKGLQSLHSLTKWMIDKLDDMGLSRFLPKMPGENIMTPEEENARFLQGDMGEPVEGEDHQDHLKKHTVFLMDSLTPDEIKPNVVKHIQMTVQILRDQLTQQSVMQYAQQNQPGSMGAPGQPQIGGPNVVTGGIGSGAGQGPVGVLPTQGGVVGGTQGGVNVMPPKRGMPVVGTRM